MNYTPSIFLSCAVPVSQVYSTASDYAGISLLCAFCTGKKTSRIQERQQWLNAATIGLDSN